MSEKRTITRSIPVVLLAAIAAGAAFVVGAGPQFTDAAWTVTKTLAITATAVNPARPTALLCVAPGSGGLGSPIPFSWTAPAGTPPSGYTLKWTGGATGMASFATTSGTVPSTGVLLGNLTVSVYSDYGSWQSLAGTQTRQVTSIAFGTLWSCS
jgi:hypothetical protein